MGSNFNISITQYCLLWRHFDRGGSIGHAKKRFLDSFLCFYAVCVFYFLLCLERIIKMMMMMMMI